MTFEIDTSSTSIKAKVAELYRDKDKAGGGGVSDLFVDAIILADVTTEELLGAAFAPVIRYATATSQWRTRERCLCEVVDRVARSPGNRSPEDHDKDWREAIDLLGTLDRAHKAAWRLPPDAWTLPGHPGEYPREYAFEALLRKADEHEAAVSA